VRSVVDTRSLLRQALPRRAGVLAGPLAATVDDWVADRVDVFFASEEFERLWATAAVRAHDASVHVLRGDGPNVDGDGITLDLLPVVSAVLADVVDRAPAQVRGRQSARGWGIPSL